MHVHVHAHCTCTHKAIRKETLPSCQQFNMEDTVLSEINQRERQLRYEITYIWNGQNDRHSRGCGETERHQLKVLTVSP